MPFVKLDCAILTSTLWLDRDAREVFLTALLMAEPHEVREPIEQLQVQAIKPTGFVIPPGWYGFVPAAGPGIIHRAGVDQATGLAALERLGDPEHESRTPDFDGRRLVRVPGGYIVLNYMRFRDRDYTGAERTRRWRERLKADGHGDGKDVPRDAVTRHGDGVTPSRDASRREKRDRHTTETTAGRPAAAPATPPDPGPDTARKAEAAASIRATLAVLQGGDVERSEALREASRTPRGATLNDLESLESASLAWLETTRKRLQSKLGRPKPSNGNGHHAEPEPVVLTAPDPEAVELWNTVRDRIKPTIHPVAFATWFRPSTGYRFDGCGNLEIAVPGDAFEKRMLAAYVPTITEALATLAAEKVTPRRGFGFVVGTFGPV